MKDLEHSRLMLAAAERDIKALRAMKDKDAFADEIFGFHAQQAVEKGLKAWLSATGTAYPKTHDLEELLALLKESGADAAARYSALADLTDFSVQFRYDSFEELGGPLNRAEVVRDVAALLAQVKSVVEAG